MTKRSYNNQRRAQKQQQTKEAIIAAMVTAAAAGQDDLPVADLAESAGVSLRTVYTHFPDKQARTQAMDAWARNRGGTGHIPPQHFDDIPNYTERLVDHFLSEEPSVRAQMAPGLPQSTRILRTLEQAKFLRAALKERITNMAQIDRLTALITSTLRAEAVYDMRDIYGLTPTQIKQTLRRSVQLLIDDFATL